MEQIASLQLIYDRLVGKNTSKDSWVHARYPTS